MTKELFIFIKSISQMDKERTKKPPFSNLAGAWVISLKGNSPFHH